MKRFLISLTITIIGLWMVYPAIGVIPLIGLILVVCGTSGMTQEEVYMHHKNPTPSTDEDTK